MAGSPDSVHVHVFMHNPHVQEETIVNLAGLDEITADNDVNDTEIRYMCNVVYTAAGDSLTTESTVGLLKELLRHAHIHSQKSAMCMYNFVIIVLECTYYFFTTMLPLFLLNAIVSRLAHVISGQVIQAREKSQIFKDTLLR